MHAENKIMNQQPTSTALHAETCSASSFAPPAIYLQYHGDAEDAEPVDDEFSEENVTWCRDAIFRHGVRYVRWDLVERLLSDVMQIHADPNDAGHNQCDEEKCQWCEWASELFKQNAPAQTPPDSGTKNHG